MRPTLLDIALESQMMPHNCCIAPKCHKIRGCCHNTLLQQNYGVLRNANLLSIQAGSFWWVWKGTGFSRGHQRVDQTSRFQPRNKLARQDVGERRGLQLCVRCTTGGQETCSFTFGYLAQSIVFWASPVVCSGSAWVWVVESSFCARGCIAWASKLSCSRGRVTNRLSAKKKSHGPSLHLGCLS